MECLGKVKNIIIEKPVTLKISDAKKLLINAKKGDERLCCTAKSV